MDDDQVNDLTNAAIANELGRIFADANGRGPQRSRAFVDGDVVVCVLEDLATPAQRLLLDAGHVEYVASQRDSMQRMTEAEQRESVARITGRRVRTVFSGSSTDGESAIEVFLLDT